MNEPTDTDTTGPFAIGTGRSDQKSVLDLQPNWVADGYGIRGPQRPVQQERATPAGMDFRPPSGDKQGGDVTPSGGVTVTTEDASGYVPGAGVGTVANVTILTFDHNNFEIYDGGGGQCVVKLKTCPATCP